MKGQELLREPTVEALSLDDEWKLFADRSTLDEIELNYGSISAQVDFPERAKFEVKNSNRDELK